MKLSQVFWRRGKCFRFRTAPREEISSWSCSKCREAEITISVLFGRKGNFSLCNGQVEKVVYFHGCIFEEEKQQIKWNGDRFRENKWKRMYHLKFWVCLDAVLINIKNLLSKQGIKIVNRSGRLDFLNKNQVVYKAQHELFHQRGSKFLKYRLENKCLE